MWGSEQVGKIKLVINQGVLIKKCGWILFRYSLDTTT